VIVQLLKRRIKQNENTKILIPKYYIVDHDTQERYDFPDNKPIPRIGETMEIKGRTYGVIYITHVPERGEYLIIIEDMTDYLIDIKEEENK